MDMPLTTTHTSRVAKDTRYRRGEDIPRPEHSRLRLQVSGLTPTPAELTMLAFALLLSSPVHTNSRLLNGHASNRARS